MTISRADFLSFITELVERNSNLGMQAVVDGLFANVLKWVSRFSNQDLYVTPTWELLSTCVISECMPFLNIVSPGGNTLWHMACFVHTWKQKFKQGGHHNSKLDVAEEGFVPIYKSSKINKFTKSPSSRAGIPIVGFLVTNSVIKDKKSALEMAIRPS